MRIPQSMQELRRMRPEEQRQAGEMLGRLLMLNPEQVSQVTKIDPAELQALLQPPGAPAGAASTVGAGQQAPPGAPTAPSGAPAQPPASQRPAPADSVPQEGTYGVLQDVSDGKGLTMLDSRSGQSRPAKPGDHPGPTEVLMAGSEILQMGVRAHMSVRMREKAKKMSEARV